MSVSLSNLLCYYNFDASSNYALQSGTSILNIYNGLYDLSYNGTEGVISISGTQKKTGNGSLYRNASNIGDYYVCSSYVGNITVNNGFTFSVWARQVSGIGNYCMILGDNTSNIGLYITGLGAGVQASRGINVQFSNFGTNNTWAHILITVSYSGGTTTIKTYINGVQYTSLFGVGGSPFGGSGGSQTDGVITYSGSILTGDTSLYIGGYKNTVLGNTGYIDEVLLFNRVLSASEITALYNLNYSIPVTIPAILGSYPCFKQGTRILACTKGQYQYVPVETLKRGDLVKTYSRGFIPIHTIGFTVLENPRDDPKKDNRLYRFTPDDYPELEEDIFITGNHCILHQRISDKKRQQVEEHMGKIYITDGKYRVPAFLDDRAKPYEQSGPVKIWHFALENNDRYDNYGVFANGLLVESSSIRYMNELSNMELI